MQSQLNFAAVHALVHCRRAEAGGFNRCFERSSLAERPVCSAICTHAYLWCCALMLDPYVTWLRLLLITADLKESNFIKCVNSSAGSATKALYFRRNGKSKQFRGKPDRDSNCCWVCVWGGGGAGWKHPNPGSVQRKCRAKQPVLHPKTIDQSTDASHVSGNQRQ
jgi:hypothetical protein